MDASPIGASEKQDAGFISLVSPVQVRPPLFSDFGIDHAPANDHHSRPGHSASDLKTFFRSPLEYYHRKVAGDAPQKDSPALQYGELIHQWLEFGDERFWDTAKIVPDSVLTATGQMGKAAKEWLAEQGDDALIITPADASKLRGQTAGILANPAAVQLIEETVDHEFNCRWKWQGHPMRCRVDAATDMFWFDLKTTRLADASRAASAFDEFGYDLQDAVYRLARRASGNWPEGQMRFIVTSTVWPYHCHVTHLPERITDAAERCVLRMMEEIKTRHEWDSWLPAGYGEVIEMDCPPWAFRGRE